MSPIVKTTESYADSVHSRHIAGLNLFIVNNVQGLDPRIAFLQQLASNVVTSAIIGSNVFVSHLGVQNSDVLQRLESVNSFIKVGLYVGSFFSLDEYPVEYAWYIPRISSGFWDHNMSDGKLFATYLMGHDSLAICVGAAQPIREDKFPIFVNENKWLSDLTGHYDLVILTGGDGYYIDLYAKEIENLKQIEPALDAAINTITVSGWYRENQDRLVWDEADDCLTVVGH